jgi:hypothetical protein
MNGIHEVTGSIPVWSTTPSLWFRASIIAMCTLTTRDLAKTTSASHL